MVHSSTKRTSVDSKVMARLRSMDDISQLVKTQPDIHHLSNVLLRLIRSNRRTLAMGMIRQMHSHGYVPLARTCIFADAAFIDDSQDQQFVEIIRGFNRSRFGKPQSPIDSPEYFLARLNTLTATADGFQQAKALFLSIDWKTQTKFDDRTVQAAYRFIITGYCKHERDVNRISELFDDLNGRKLNASVVISALSAFVELGAYRKAIGVVERVAEYGLKPGRHMFNLLIRAYTEVGDFEAALQAFSEMERNGVIPTLPLYTSVLVCVCKGRGMEAAEQFFVDSLASKDLDVFVFNVMMDGYASCQDLDKMLLWLDYLKERGLIPDRYTYTILKKGFLLNSDASISDAVDFDAKFEQYSGVPSESLQSIVSDTILLQHLLSRQTLNKALSWFYDATSRNSHSMDQTAYSKLIWGYLKHNCHDAAAEMVESLRKTGMPFDKHLFQIAILSFWRSHADSEEMFRLYREMLDSGFTPKPSTYLAMALCCIRCQDAARLGLLVYDILAAPRTAVTLNLYGRLLNIFKYSSWDGAVAPSLQFLNKMNDDNIPINADYVSPLVTKIHNMDDMLMLARLIQHNASLLTADQAASLICRVIDTQSATTDAVELTKSIIDSRPALLLLIVRPSRGDLQTIDAAMESIVRCLASNKLGDALYSLWDYSSSQMTFSPTTSALVIEELGVNAQRNDLVQRVWENIHEPTQEECVSFRRALVSCGYIDDGDSISQFVDWLRKNNFDRHADYILQHFQ